MLSELQKIDYEIIDNFRKTGKSEGIPEHLQRYILHLDYAALLYHKCSNMMQCARDLQAFFKEDKISINTARSRIADAITVFHLNMQIPAEAWDSFYCDKLANLEQLAIINNDLKTAHKCIVKQWEIRTKRDEIKYTEDQLRPNIIFITPDITATLLNVEERTKMQIKKRINDLRTKELINKLPVTDQERQQLEIDADL